MTDLDTLARAATRELLDHGTPDVPTRYAELRRVRSRRTAAKLTGVAAAVALAAGGWRLASSPDQHPKPAPKPSEVLNGTLVAGAGAWSTVSGKPLPQLPHDSMSWSTMQFTSDGSSVVYPDLAGQVVLTELATGTEHKLAGCLGSCLMSLSPDGQVLAFAARGGVQLLTLSTGHVELLPVEGSLQIGRPVWSPDGTALAFADKAGLFVMNADGSDVRMLHASSDPSSGPLTTSWSPTGRSVAFFDPQPLSGGGPGKTKIRDDRYTVEVVDLATGDVTVVHDAGHCYCLGLTPPALTWSPDGQEIAVATTHGVHDPGGEKAPGVYVVHPDGSGWRRLAVGDFYAVAWQPLTD